MSTWRLRGPVRIDADHEVAEVWVIDDRISFDRPRGELTGTIEGVVIPGLVDAHCHIGLIAEGAADAATTLAQARADRDAGVLLVRDAGSPADTRWLDEHPDLPEIIRAGRHIGRTRRYLRDVSIEVEPELLVAEVTRQAARGDGWVKVVGDWIDRDAGDLMPCWPGDVLKPAIDAAHAAGARVTAHCFGAEALPDLIAAGIDGIEHGTGFTADTIAAAAASGVAVVPTLMQIDTFPELADAGQRKFPVWAARMRDLHRRRLETVDALWHAGVPLFAGTDAGTVHAHGQISAEIALLAGVLGDRVAAVGSASWAAREWLGRPGITEGAPADLVVFDGDPTLDLAVLGTPRAVIRGGVVVAGR